MPDRGFLEKYPLYRKFELGLPETLIELEKPAINMHCSICGSDQTFNMVNRYYEQRGASAPLKGVVVRAVYKCASCEESLRFFFLKLGPEGNYVMKVGQEPPWDISLDRTLENMLGDHSEYYSKGLVCESQGYGIGAFSYYRRIVEEIIDELLLEIADLMTDEEQERYLDTLEQVKTTTVTQDKIDLVKDLLPPILRPDGMNPLSMLHSVLSQGLHGELDEQSIELAMTVREVLIFLVNQVTASREAARSFTASMRKLLSRRKK